MVLNSMSYPSSHGQESKLGKNNKCHFIISTFHTLFITIPCIQVCQQGTSYCEVDSHNDGKQQWENMGQPLELCTCREEKLNLMMHAWMYMHTHIHTGLPRKFIGPGRMGGMYITDIARQFYYVEFSLWFCAAIAPNLWDWMFITVYKYLFNCWIGVTVLLEYFDLVLIN